LISLAVRKFRDKPVRLRAISGTAMTKVPRSCLVAGLTFTLGFAPSPGRPHRHGRNIQEPPSTIQSGTTENTPGQTTTLLPDGTSLLLGGAGAAGPLADAFIAPADGRQPVRLSTSLNVARAWHTATLLPDGTVLVFGGADGSGNIIGTAELFDPSTQTFKVIATPDLTPRAYHTATLLTDGTMLIAGGLASDSEVPRAAQIWDPQAKTATTLPAELTTSRRNHSATLLPDGTVLLWGGIDDVGRSLANGDLYDPEAESFTQVESIPAEGQPSDSPSASGPTLAASAPENGAVSVAVGAVLSLRFSEPLDVTTVNAATVTLAGPSTNIPVRVVPSEKGMLAFVTPAQPLLPGAIYTLSLNGLADPAKRSLPSTQITFTTAAPAVPLDDEAWIPDGSDWRTERPDSSWRKLPPLQAPPGTTAIAGQVLKLNGLPLANVTLKVDNFSTLTDSTGRFLLTLGAGMSGHCVLVMNGATANRPGKAYGLFQYGMNIGTGITNVLPFTIWMPLLDTAHAVTIPSPTKKDTVITSPLLPGLELLLPAGTVIWDYSGHIARTISITPIPLDRPPFPLPAVQVPIYFTIQPGGAWLSFNNPNGPQGAQLFYPNTYNKPPATVYDFWNYDPTGRGWYVYGLGKVSPNGQSIVPNRGVFVYGFTGAMVGGVNDYLNGPAQGNNNGTCCEPVDLGTGLFVYTHTDLAVPDVIPLVLTRTYRQNDVTTSVQGDGEVIIIGLSLAFGVGATHPYDIFLYRPSGGDIYLVLPDGGSIHFSASGECTDSPTSFYGATVAEISDQWVVTKKDGTVLTFPAPFTGAKTPQQEAIIGYQDRNGNKLTFSRDANSNLTQITSPNGRYIQFTLDPAGRITQATDNIGRIVRYAYDGGGRLTQVTDANGGITTYAYDGNNNMLSITDPRGIQYLTNQYDSNNRVVTQTLADGSVYQISYTLDSNGNVSQATVKDPLKNTRQVTFNSNGYTASDTLAVGTPQEEAYTFNRDLSTNLLSSMTDPLGRVTSFTYDGLGNLSSVTQLSGTSGAVTTSFTYQQAFMPGLFSQLTKITDPLSHATLFGYDSSGDLTSLTDPLNDQWTFTYNSQGQPVSATDPLLHPTSFAYNTGDLISVTDPLLRTTYLGRDGAGRLVGLQDPAGAVTVYQYDPLDQLLTTTDPLGSITSFFYDQDGDLSSLVDARQGSTQYGYDSLDRLSIRIDPLGHSESYMYDANGNLLTFTDRKNQKTTFTYDPLNRLTKMAYADRSSTSYAYDLGNRLTAAKDSIFGTINRSYDNLDRLTSETTPQGSVTYKYDNASRRTQMTVAGQTAIDYHYDNANRLTKLAQGTSTYTLSYDNANRRILLTLPNGVTSSYGYDKASELTGLTYKFGTTTLGSLTYSYDADGRRTSVGGSYARTGLPTAVASASYNADNQLTQWGTASLNYDLDGNLINDGANTYTWNARNQLASIGGAAAASFQYDGVGRRQTKTISGTSTSFLYDGVNPVQELAGTTVAANLVTGLAVDEIFSRTDSAGVRNFLADALGSTLALTDSTGMAQTQYTYEPFGNTTTAGSTGSNSYQFSGRENDHTGLYYYRSRYYSPLGGRFISEDPLGWEAGVNSYTYTLNSPTNFVDPSGLDIAVIENGPTIPYGGNNPFGHTAIAITGHGVYSFGNDVDLGSSTGAYVWNQASKRDSVVYVIHTTPAQDALALAYLQSFRTWRLPAHSATKDNCSTRSNKALDAAGVGRLPGTLEILPGSAGFRALLEGADAYEIFQGSTSLPLELGQFEPRKQ